MPFGLLFSENESPLDAYRTILPKSPTKEETRENYSNFFVSGWLIMDGGGSVNEKQKIPFNMKYQYNYQPLQT